MAGSNIALYESAYHPCRRQAACYSMRASGLHAYGLAARDNNRMKSVFWRSDGGATEEEGGTIGKRCWQACRLRACCGTSLRCNASMAVRGIPQQRSIAPLKQENACNLGALASKASSYLPKAALLALWQAWCRTACGWGRLFCVLP